MKSFKFLPLFLSVCLLLSLCCAPGAAAAAEPSVSAPSAIVLDRHSGTVIYSKAAQERVYPASTTKIMTVLLAVEAIERGDVSAADEVTCTATALQGLSELGSSAGILAGETLTLEQLMYCAMVSSANEACNVIAEYLGGSVSGFAELMNQRAAELGCTATHFANAHGLPNLDHYTTAADFALVALEATAHPLFMEICGTAEKEIPASNKSPARALHNSNALICAKSIYGDDWLYEGASGIKTGHTTAAGYCLASAAARNGVELVALVFGDASSSACFRDTIALYDWAFANYSYKQLLTPTDHLGRVPVMTDGTVDYVELCPATNFTLLLPNDCDVSEFSREVTVYAPENGGALPGPVTPGTVLGKVHLVKDGQDYGSVDLVPVSSAALIMDRQSGEILYSKGADNRIYPADTTKLMTALLAVEAVESGSVSLKDHIAATEVMNTGLDASSSRSGFKSGETLTLESLLYCLLLGSGDDAANLIADHVGGSVDSFVASMNRRAEQLGCGDTNFMNPHGGFSEDHYTTARDLCTIALEASRHTLLMKICGTAVTELEETDLSPARTLKNTNALLCDESVYGGGWLYEGATGMKTGYNTGAGYCLVSTAARDGVDLLCAVFGGVKQDGDISSFSDTIALYDWVFENYSYQEVLKSTENLASVDVALGSNADFVNLRPSSSITVLLPNDYDPEEFRKNIVVYALADGETLTAPVSAGQVMGEVTLMRGDRSYGTVKLVAAASVDLSRIQYIKAQIGETLRSSSFRLIASGIVLLFGLYIAWVIIYRCKRVKYLRSVRAAEQPQEAAPAHRERSAPRLPKLSFFRPNGSLSAPEEISLPAEADAPEAAPPVQDAAPVTPLYPLAPPPAASGPETKPEPEAKPEPKPEPRPHTPVPPADPASAEEDPLLAHAVRVAELPKAPAAPPVPEPTREETDAERDYFEEFFRRKP